MRDQGRLIEWFDDRGYGFIQPQDSSKDRVFLHIKDFSRPGPRPIVGCALEYQVQIDGQGRYRAQQVIYLKASQIKSSQANQPAPVVKQAEFSQQNAVRIGSIVYICVLAGSALLGWLNGLVLLMISLINPLSYWLYVKDKHAAQMRKPRIPENVLHLCAVLGGWPAAYLAQEHLRHKTQKQPFRKIYFCTIVMNIILVIWLISPFSFI